ncbi:MAG: hypothetical protein KAR38_12050 [Calditrichia bacterium]|nr:hypothetical protein [Calditrichia bacterium]
MTDKEQEFNVTEIAYKGNSFLLKIWAVIFIFTLFLFLHPLLGKYYSVFAVPLNVTMINNFKDLFFIIFAIFIISIFFIKRTWLSYKILANMVRKEKDLKKTWGLPIPPFIGELSFGHGILYHVRKTILLIYTALFSSILLCEGYFYLTGDKRNIFLYATIILFSLMLNFPRKSLISKIIYLIQEDDHDQE